MMIGTNNLHLNTDEEIIAGLDLLIRAIQTRQPSAEIIILGIYPRREKEERVAQLNLKIARLTGNQNVQYADVGTTLLTPDGKADESLFTDGLHPNEAGYRKLGEVIRTYLE